MSLKATNLKWRWADSFILDINQVVLHRLTSHVSLQRTVVLHRLTSHVSLQRTAI